MAKLPSPFSSDLHDFTAVITMVRELLDAGKVRLKASPAANISYRITAMDLNTVAEKHGVRPSLARSILNEISAIASLILQRRVERAIRDMTEQPAFETGARLSDEEKNQVISALREKFSLVESQLVTERVRQKFHSTRASKHESLLRIRWEVIDRKYDQDEGEKAAGPIALVKFELGSRPEVEIFPLGFGLDASQRRSFVLEFDEDDLDDLISTLTEAKQRLSQEGDRTHG
jgi:hypothetical protein